MGVCGHVCDVQRHMCTGLDAATVTMHVYAGVSKHTCVCFCESAGSFTEPEV